MTLEDRLSLIEDAIRRINERLGPDEDLVIRGLGPSWLESIQWEQDHAFWECYTMINGTFYRGRGLTPHDAKKAIASAIRKDLV